MIPECLSMFSNATRSGQHVGSQISLPHSCTLTKDFSKSDFTLIFHQYISTFSTEGGTQNRVKGYKRAGSSFDFPHVVQTW